MNTETRIMPLEHRARISAALTGRTLSPEHKAKKDFFVHGYKHGADDARTATQEVTDG